jgi:NADPH:quinone reductase
VVDRSIADVVEEVRQHTGGHGVAAVFDPVGAATYETSLRLLAPRAYFVNYGQLSGALPDVDLGRLMEAGSIFVTKYGPRAGLVRPEHVGALISEALRLATTRPLVSDVAARLPLTRVGDAYRALDSRVPGKVLVLPHAGNDSGA